MYIYKCPDEICTNPNSLIIHEIFQKKIIFHPFISTKKLLVLKDSLSQKLSNGSYIQRYDRGKGEDKYFLFYTRK